MKDWKSIKETPPPKDVELLTKIHDEHGERNEAKLTKIGHLWFDKGTYVYYQPTHWCHIEE